MFVTISSNGGPLPRKLSAPAKTACGCCAFAVILASLALVLSSQAHSQVAAPPSTSWSDFVGTYKERNTEKRVRVLQKDGQLICETADGLSLNTFHLLQPVPGDAFEIEEAEIRQQVKFVRDGAGRVSGLTFGGRAYFRTASIDLSAPPTPDNPLRSPLPFPGPAPARLPPDFAGKTGDFADQSGKDVMLLLERSRRLILRDSAGIEHPLYALRFIKTGDITSYTYTGDENDPWVLAFEQRGTDPIWQMATQLGPYHRLAYSVPAGSTILVKPPRPLAQIRGEALAASPPQEQGQFRRNDLVELAGLDHAIHLDIRYATSRNFLGAPVYTQARAFLQRPAAESLVRALHRLQALGYGLLIHDGYRPWYITKIFWEATPTDGKIFVADPAQGSRHNRGCAVDLTLYDLKTDQPVEMTGLYDEMSPRSFPDYSGGTSLQRWHRDLLRWAMESEGFTVYESEWWHFDYKDWPEYAIANIPFEKLGITKH